ncbi:unnamed protein product [Psylliodes chrysocephalus]|uniref:Uncharacterized protein n=1 Tax=Psylliodes chrysocephalus TaxID=3402493 RepID=A0A9P0GF90_9CUCU|nr:unnamed protein product [Psylliodes chrysocephala]
MEIVKALYFDGQKDKSLTHNKKGDKYYYNTISEKEHISLVKEPGSIYLGHLALLFGAAILIKDVILDFYNRKEILIESLIAVGCDGTNDNTETNAGIIRLLEIAINRPLQWFIPLRHLLIQLNGVIQGPKAFSGAIEKSI